MPSVFEAANGLKGYAYPDGAIAIEPRFIMANDFGPDRVALAATSEEWIFIDTNGTALAPSTDGWRHRDPADSASFQIFLLDNGPDDFREGAARFWSHRGMGLFSRDGRILLAPSYSFVEPVKNGFARVCDGCRRIDEGEHYRHDGGVWRTVPVRTDETPGKTPR